MHGHHDGHHHHHGASGKHLLAALALTLSFAGVEIAVGFWSGSLTLLGDATHMATDSVALGIAAAAAWLAQRPPSERHSYGLGRTEVIAALINALLMLAVVLGITVEAVERLGNPPPVRGGAVLVVAALGFVINALIAFILMRSESTLNTRAALLHVLGDLLGSVAAITAGAVIYLSGWNLIDPILALLVSCLILYSTLKLLRESLHVVMEGVPRHLDLPTIGRRMASVAHVESIHDLHIWTLSSGQIVLSAHVVLRDMNHWDSILNQLRELLDHDYGIDHVTLQPESNEHILYPLNYPDASVDQSPPVPRPS